MKNFRKILLIFVLIFALSFAFACGEEENNNDNNKNDQTEQPEDVFYTVSFEVDYEIYESQKVKEGEKAVKPTNPSLEGMKFVEWKLDGVTFDFNTEINKDILLVAEFKNETYSVTVKYEDGTPANGVYVKWCTEETCLVPVMVDENGFAEKDKSEFTASKYYVHLEEVPQGYTYDVNAYETDLNNKDLEITLLPLSTFVGEGNKESAYVVEKGVYRVTYEESEKSSLKYFSFTAKEDGVVTLISLSEEKAALNPCNPYLGIIGQDINGAPNPAGNPESKDEINFEYEMEVKAGETYYFVIMLGSKLAPMNYPCHFDLMIK